MFDRIEFRRDPAFGWRHLSPELRRPMSRMDDTFGAAATPNSLGPQERLVSNVCATRAGRAALAANERMAAVDLDPDDQNPAPEEGVVGDRLAQPVNSFGIPCSGRRC